MDFRIVKVDTREQLKRFVTFPMLLYRNEPNYVPPLLSDEYGTLSKGSPVQDSCDSELYLAMRDGEVLGRVAAIVNHTANRALGRQNVRFGWFDCVNDHSVAAALLDRACDFGRGMRMKTVTGPSGYSRFDKKGMLINGFEHRPTVATLYNFPYYRELLERCGFEKDMDMIEQFIPDMSLLPQKFIRGAEHIRKKGEFRLLDLASIKKALRTKKQVMDLMEAVLMDHYDSFPMTEPQRTYCANKFLPYLNPRLTKVVMNSQDQMVAFLIAMPNLSRAFQKANGRLLPFGFSHIWRALHSGNDVLDFCVGGIRKEYRRRGLDLLMGVDLFLDALKLGYNKAETNPELETNTDVQKEWRDLNPIERRRRRVFIKQL